MVPSTSIMADGIDKIDMSLDDIIKLNKQEQNSVLFNGRTQTGSFQQFRSNRGGWGARHRSGAGNMRLQGMKNLYGVKMGSWKGVSPLSRAPLSVRNSGAPRLPFRRRLTAGNKSTMQRYYFSRGYANVNTFRSGLRMKQQRDTRHATFFHSRGLKVQTNLDNEHLDELMGTRQWRASMNSNGILTVSIENPSAGSSSIGTRLPRPPLPFLLKKEGSETKVPKGVALDFDINSVAKQTGITLNERFKILKDQRLSQSIGKGSRYVTVG